MLRMIKNNYNRWKVLLKALSEEIPEDAPEFIAWLEEDEEHEHLYRTLKEGTDSDSLFDPDEMYRKIAREAGIEEPKRKLQSLIASWKYIAAVVLAAILSGTFYWYQKNALEEKMLAVVENPKEESPAPGSRKATLLLDDGSTVELNNEFEISKKDGTRINNDTTGRISYTKQKKSQVKPEHHTIQVPIGGEYELILADGTRVFLNSETKLTYPSFFEGDARSVKLEGEAYFDVAKNEKPFIVETDDVDINVLGTSFNLSAYDNEMGVATTLVTGSVEVKTKADDRSFQIAPGYQLTVDRSSGKVSKEKVETSIYTSWTKGEFIFRDQTMGNILTKLSRWYNFTIDYADPSIQDLRFTGSAEKKRPLAYFLNQIETVTNIKFKEYGNKIVAYR